MSRVATLDHLKYLFGNFDFGNLTVAGEVFDGAAVSGPACGIQRLVRRIAGKSLLDEADGFKPCFPILLGNALQAGEDILHGHIVGGLPGMFLVCRAIEVITAPQHDIAELRHGGGIEVALVAQPLHQLHHERKLGVIGKRRRHGFALCQRRLSAKQSFGKRIRLGAGAAGNHGAAGDPRRVFDQ